MPPFAFFLWSGVVRKAWIVARQPPGRNSTGTRLAYGDQTGTKRPFLMWDCPPLADGSELVALGPALEQAAKRLTTTASTAAEINKRMNVYFYGVSAKTAPSLYVPPTNVVP